MAKKIGCTWFLASFTWCTVLLCTLPIAGVLKRYYFLADESDRDFDFWYQSAGFVSMLFYFFLCLRYYRLYRRLMVQVTSYADALVFRWVQRFLIAFFAMLLVWLAFEFLGQYIKDQYIRSWWYFLCFSILLYYIAIAGYSNGVITKVPFVANLLAYKPRLLLPQPNSAPITSSPPEEIAYIELVEPPPVSTEPDAALQIWKDKISHAVIDNQAFQNPELSLTELAQQLQTNPSLLSKMINRGFAMNFNDFINYYRVQAVIAELHLGRHKAQTLMSIAYDCGFNSKATFNRAFKKATGHNPQEWLKEQGK